ncbi:MAG TPA: iron-sulfur cluster biosynthesis family protein [Thermoleophilaceae bacterium]|jgi:Fe-S cluster assembly iron-binding protein IscA
MLTITADAAEAIAHALEEAPDAAGIRIAHGDGSMNGSGPSLEVEMVPEPELDDEVIEAKGARLFLDPETAVALDGKVLHAEEDEGEIRFAIIDTP